MIRREFIGMASASLAALMGTTAVQALTSAQRSIVLFSNIPPAITASIIQGAGTSASVRLDTTDGQPTTIDWGDGTVVKNNSGSTASHTYAAAYNGPVNIRTVSRSSQITRFDSSSGNWSFNLSALPRSLTYLNLVGNGLTVSGSIAGLTALTYLQLNGTGLTVSGSIAGLTSLTYLTLFGNGITVSGSIAGLTALTSLTLYGTSLTISGSIAGLTALTYLYFTGAGITVSGSIAGLTALNTLYLNGAGLTVSGSIAGLTALTYLYLAGNSVTVIVPDAWTGVTSGARVVYGRSYTVATSTIDNLLISLAAVVVSWSTEKTVNLKGSRTSASDAAVTTLNGKGVTVTVSP